MADGVGEKENPKQPSGMDAVSSSATLDMQVMFIRMGSLPLPCNLQLATYCVCMEKDGVFWSFRHFPALVHRSSPAKDCMNSVVV